MTPKYSMNLKFVRRVSNHLFVLSEPIQGTCMRKDSIPMPFTDMKNYITRLIDATRDHDDINVYIVNAEGEQRCVQCGHDGVDGGIFAYDKREQTTFITEQFCSRCLLNHYFIIKMLSTTDKGER